MKSDKRRQLIAATALMPLLGALHTPPDLVPFLYSLFAIAFFIHEKKLKVHTADPKKNSENHPEPKPDQKPKAKPEKIPELNSQTKSDEVTPKYKWSAYTVFHFLLLFIATGLTGIVLAWTTKKLAPEQDTALLLTRYLGNSMVIATLEFGAMALVWLALSRWRKFDLRQVFFIQGILALVLDPHAGILCAQLSSNFFYSYSELCGLILIYGSIVALPWTTFSAELAGRAKGGLEAKFFECTAALIAVGAAGKLCQFVGQLLSLA